MNNSPMTIPLSILLEITDEGKINLDEILDQHKLTYQNKILISSKQLYQKYKEYLNFKIKEKFFINTLTLDEIEIIIKNIKNLSNDSLLIGFGGGRVIDATKYIGLKAGLNFISLPTALSHDGIYSPVAVLSQDNGMKIRIGTLSPIGIVVNLDIVQQAPIETIRSGIGDLLSNLSALKDWEIAKKDKGEQIDNFAYALSYLAYNNIFNFLDKSNLNLNDKEFLKNLAYSLIISGLSMEIAGSSRPCSGAEHLFSHAIDYLYPKKSILHGTQVAFGILVSELFRGEEIEKLIEIYKKIGLPTSVKELGFEKNEIIQAIKIAPKMNKERYTIFNEFKLSKHLIEKKLSPLL